MEQLEELFQTNDLRMTKTRRDIFSALEQAESPLFIHDIILLCKQSNRTSIYRTLEIFHQLGIVEVIPTGWKQRYELSDLFRAHHHHLQCDQCNQLISIDTPALEQLITSIASNHNYQLTSHHIELHGICISCQMKKGWPSK